MRDELVQVPGNRSDIFRNAPLVVVEDTNKLLRGMRDIVQALKRNAIRERRVTKDADDMLIALALITRGAHAERRGKRRARVARAIAIVFALRAERETIQPARGADGVKPIFAPRQKLVNVNLMAH